MVPVSDERETSARGRLAMPIDIGSLQIRNRCFLAPMSGVSDAPFRQLAWSFGAGLVVSEMIASEALVDGNTQMRLKAEKTDARPNMIQLAGRDQKWMVLAAQLACDQGADIIDINMGCPARRVTTGKCGSALMREPELALRLIEAVVGAVDVPVTVKMRLGWDHGMMNAPDLAAAAQSAGAAMITVHGRTRCQFYKGTADWQAVRAVRQRIDIPLVVNGDIANATDVENAIRLSGADAVMVGRASYGAPWLPGNLVAGHHQEAKFSIADLIAGHVDAMMSLYGSALGMRVSRKHLAWYRDRYGDKAKFGESRSMLTCNSASEIFSHIRSFFEGARLENAA